MNDIALLAEYGPEAEPVTAGVLADAKLRLLARIDEPRKVRAIRRPAIPFALAGGVAAAIAIAMVTATAPNAPPTPAPAESRSTHTGAQPGPTPGNGITLVAFDAPVFPLAFRPVPAGARAPVFSGVFEHGRPVVWGASYPGTDLDHLVSLMVSTTQLDRTGSGRTRATTFDGKPAVLFTDVSVVALSWLRKPGQWVTVNTLNGGASEARARQLARTVVDQPQQVPMQIHLAPAGWVLTNFRGNDDIGLRDAHSRDERRKMYVQLLPRLTRNLRAVLNFGPIRKVTVNGRPGQIAENGHNWVLEGTLPDGTAFRLWTPRDLTEPQVNAIGAQVTRN